MRSIRNQACISRRRDGLQYLVASVLNFLILKSQHAKALPAQPIVSTRVLCPVVMMRSVGFNDQPVPEADKVDDVAADDELPPKLQPAEAAITQQFPQATFVQDGLAPHFLRTLLKPYVHRLFYGMARAICRCRPDPSSDLAPLGHLLPQGEKENQSHNPAFTMRPAFSAWRASVRTREYSGRDAWAASRRRCRDSESVG